MRNVWPVSLWITILLPLLFLGGCIGDTKPADSKGATAKTGITPTNGVAMSKDELSAKADIPLYPGAEVPEGQSKVTPTSVETRYEINMYTSDSVDKVADFYKDKLHMDKQGTSSSANLLGMTPKGELAKITVEAKDGKTHIQAVAVDEKKQ